MLNQISNMMTGGHIAMDLGTANTLIWIESQGIIINEPSIVAKNTIDNSVVAVGNEAYAMLGRTPGGIQTIRPLKDGVIADFDMTDGMIQGFVKKMNIVVIIIRVVHNLVI